MISGKRIIITGANSGIGLETLKLLNDNNNTILAVDISTDRLLSFGTNSVIPFKCDLSDQSGVDAMFDKAISSLGGIDMVFAYAGIPYYEKIDYADWNRVKDIFDINVISQIYTYMKFREHLDGTSGHFILMISAMGYMGMPGFTLYTSTKFALNGFRDAISFEKPENMKLSCVYPVSTDTNFFKTANERNFSKPYPVQSAETVAKAIVKGVEKGKRKISPSRMFSFATVLFWIIPGLRRLYRNRELKKFQNFTQEDEGKRS